MNKIRNYFKATTLALSLVLLAVGCKKEEVLSLQRQFSPSTITATNGETKVMIAWPVSLFTMPGQATYTLEISKTVDFATVDYTKTTKFLGDTINDTKLAIKQNYYARVKTLGLNGTPDSNYLVSSVLRITGEQFLLPVGITDLQDVAVQLTWKIPNPGFTKITITPPVAVGPPFDVPLSAPELAAGVKVVTGLTPFSNYSADIYTADNKNKGTVTFRTKQSFVAAGNGTVVDLSGTTGDATALLTALAAAPSGATIVLRRGERYNLTSYAFSKSVLIVSAMGFGTNYATIRSSGSFNGTNSTTVDSIVFKDLYIKGANIPPAATPSYDNHYLFNVSGVTNFTITKLRLENCNIKCLRGTVRGQSGMASSPTTAPTVPGLTVTNYFINNCVMDSLREYGIATASAGSMFKNITMTNTTVYRYRRYIDHRVFGNLSVTVANCTFSEVVAGAAATPSTNTVFDFNGVAAGSINVTSCIFAKVWNETGAGILIDGYKGTTGGPTVTGSYSTSDFTFQANPISGLLPYSGTYTALFTDPVNANFKIKDTGFAGRNSSGDPRWRIP